MIDYFNEEQFNGYVCKSSLINKLHNLTDKQKEKVVKYIESSTKNYLYMQGGSIDEKLDNLKVNIDNLKSRRIEYQNMFIETGKTDYFMNMLIINGTIHNIKEYIDDKLSHLNKVEIDNDSMQRLKNYDSFCEQFNIKSLVVAGAVIEALKKGAFIKELNKVCGVRLDTQNYDCEFVLRTYDGETTVRVEDFGKDWWVE